MKQKLLKTWLTMLCLLVLGGGNVWADRVTIYSENFSASSNTLITSCNSDNFTGGITPTAVNTTGKSPNGWKLGTGNAGSGTGYSGGANLWSATNNTTVTFNLGSLLSNYSDVKISFHYYKGSANGSNNTFTLTLSNDGGATFSQNKLPSNTSSAANWYSAEIDIPAEYLSSFAFRFTQTGTQTNRIDDIVITGVSTSSGNDPDPGTGGNDPDPGTGGDDPEPSNLDLALSLDFSNASEDWGMPTTKTVTGNTFTSGSYSVTMQGSTGEGYYFQTGTGNVLLGKSGATITLPTLPFAVKKIEFVGPESGASTSVTQNIYVGENEASDVNTGANGTKSYIIKDAYQNIGTQYVLKVTNDNNTQFNAIKFYAEKDDPNIPTYYNVTIGNSIANGKVSANASSYLVAGTTVSLKTNPNIGFEFSSWDVKDESNNPIDVTNNQFTMPASNVTVSATFTAIPNAKGFDLTSDLTTQGGNVSADKITFTETQFTLDFATNGGTAVNNYCPTKNAQTRLYTKNIVSVTPKAGYVVKCLRVNLNSSSPGQTAWNNGTKTNCTVVTGNASNGNPGWVEVTPIDGTSEFKVKLSNTTNIDAMLVVYGEVATITINPACTDGNKYYSTYSNNSKWEVPSDLTVSEVAITDGVLSVHSYTTGDIVPAGAGVMVSSNTSGNHTIVLTTNAATDSPSGNKNALKGTGNTGITAAAMAAEDTEFFRLTMHKGETIGFWWGAAEGAAFDLAANKAYLAVATNNLGLGGNVKESLWFSDNATAIKHVANDKQNKAIYNLNGQRVSKTQKGLYIMNGKKYLVK